MKSLPRARSPTLLRILLHSGFGAENRFEPRLRAPGPTPFLGSLAPAGKGARPSRIGLGRGKAPSNY
jgi:hypothetical protein